MLASLVQLAVLYARLDAGDEGSGPYLHDLVHQAQVQADSAAEGDGVPLQTAPFAIGHYSDKLSLAKRRISTTSSLLCGKSTASGERDA